MKSLGYVHTPITEHHRWSPHSRRPMSTGKGPFSRTTRLMLYQMRWRKPPRQYGLSVAAWVMSITVHVLVVISMLLVRPSTYPPPAPLGQQNAIHVRIIENRRPPPPPPPVPQAPRLPEQRMAKRTSAAPSQAPHLAPVPVAPPTRPRVALHVARTPLKIVAERPRPASVPPVKAVPSPVPKPELPAIPMPPPPKEVLEPSKMAIAVPRVSPQEQPPISAPSATQPPIPVAAVHPRQQISAPRLEIQTGKPVPAAVSQVQLSPGAAAPPIPIAGPKPKVSLAPTQKLDVNTSVAVQQPQVSAVAPPAALPAAPVRAPRVHIELGASPPTRIQLPATQVKPLPRLTVASSPMPAPAASTLPLPKPQVSWAQQSDQFSKLPVKQSIRGRTGLNMADSGSPAGVPKFIQHQPQGNSDVMHREFHGLHYKPTIFDQYWAPDNQSLLTSWLQKLVDALSFHKTFNLGHGVRIHCGGWLLGFGCGGDPPDAPSALSDDPRLNMPPPKPLAPGLGQSAAAPPPVVLPKSSVQSVDCETARVAGSPLPPGCPVEKGASGGLD